VLDHPEKTKVLLDKKGDFQTITNPVAPIKATNLTGKNILNIIQAEDTLVYFGEEMNKDPVLNDGVIMQFNRPSGANSAKLIVKAKNSYWLDYVFTRFHELFGKEYDCWVDKQEKIPENKMKDWTLDQKIPLSVFIEKNGKWNFVDYFNITGPMASKEDVLAIDLTDMDQETVKIKLEYGFRFWEVDYAALDFSANVPVKKHLAYFESAIDNNNMNVKDFLLASDTLYYVQPEIGDEVNMKFQLPERVDAERSIILHSKGYYKVLLNLTGEQQKKYLMTFMKKGRFPEFSNELFQQQYSPGVNTPSN